MKRIVLTLILVAFTVSAQAQMAKVQTAISHLTTYGSSFSQPELFEAPITEPDMEILMKAQEAIDIAVEHEKSKLHPKTWLTAGSVYRALSKQTAKPELHADAVNKAFECYAKVKELEEKSGKKLKLSKDAYNYTLDLKNAFYGVGYQHFDKKEYKEAFKYFKQTLDIEDMRNDNPFSKNKGTAVIDTNTIFATAYVAQQAGYNDEAIGYMQQLVDLDYNNPSVFQSLSSLYKDKGDGDMASKVMEKARKLFPDNSALVIDEINQLLKAGDEAGALEK